MKEFDNRSILSELKHMKDRMDSLLSDVFNVGTTTDGEATREASSDRWEPGTDLWETPQGWFLVADLPGVREEDLKVELVSNRITLEGRRETVNSAGDVKVHRVERPRGVFCRSFDLPPNMKNESITAELKNGVLSISIMKDDVAPQRPVKVAVRSD